MTIERERLLNGLNCANMRLRRAGRTLTDFYNSVMEPSGLHANQFTLLIPAYLDPGLPINRLSKITGLDRTTLARNLKLLEEHGWIDLRAGKDQRTREVHLTEAGRQALMAALPLWEQAQQQVIASLGREDLNQLFAILDRLEGDLPQDSPVIGQM